MFIFIYIFAVAWLKSKWSIGGKLGHTLNVALLSRRPSLWSSTWGRVSLRKKPGVHRLNEVDTFLLNWDHTHMTFLNFTSFRLKWRHHRWLKWQCRALSCLIKTEWEIFVSIKRMSFKHSYVQDRWYNWLHGLCYCWTIDWWLGCNIIICYCHFTWLHSEERNTSTITTTSIIFILTSWFLLTLPAS